MKKEKQIGIRIGVPAFFVLELEDVYRHTEGAHRALTFPDFCGFLIGLGLEAYRKENAAAMEAGQGEAPDAGEGERSGADPLHLFEMDRRALPDLFREFDEAMEEAREREDDGQRLHPVPAGEPA
jgi:hypothetical protein